jgi:hypothetical protein
MEKVPNYEPPNNKKGNTSRKRKRGHNVNAAYMKRVMKTVKFMNKSQKAANAVNIDATKELIHDVMNIPVYAIYAHSCIMGPEHAKSTGAMDYFELPKDTYMISFGTPGDYLCTGLDNLAFMREHLDELRRYLYVHDTGDVLPADPFVWEKHIDPKDKKPFYWNSTHHLSVLKIPRKTSSLFSDIKRAAATVYPNISYSLINTDKKQPIRTKYNEYGVYRIDNLPQTGNAIEHLTNKDSLVHQDLEREDYNLSDIIEEVYKKTGIKKGIFINLGCLSACGTNPAAKFLYEAGKVYEQADVVYNTLKPTLTKEEILKHLHLSYLPKNVPLLTGLAKWVPGVFEKMVEQGLYDPKAAKYYSNNFHENNWKRLKELADKK